MEDVLHVLACWHLIGSTLWRVIDCMRASHGTRATSIMLLGNIRRETDVSMTSKFLPRRQIYIPFMWRYNTKTHINGHITSCTSETDWISNIRRLRKNACPRTQNAERLGWAHSGHSVLLDQTLPAVCVSVCPTGVRKQSCCSYKAAAGNIMASN